MTPLVHVLVSRPLNGYNHFLNLQRISLEKQAMEIQLIRQPFKESPHVDLSGGVAGLADRHTQRSKIGRAHV